MNNLSFSSLVIADSVQRVALPGAAPGASNSQFNELTATMSTPGKLFAASITGHFSDTTINKDFFFLYFLDLLGLFLCR